MNAVFRSLSILAALAAALAADAQSPIFNARGSNPFNTLRSAGNAPLGVFDFSAATTIGAFGVYDAMSGPGTQDFLIFDFATGALLYDSGPVSFAGDGGTTLGLDSYKVSPALSFTFLPGVRYELGATASVSTGYYLSTQAVAQNGITEEAANTNVSGTTALGGQYCCSVGTELLAPTPEPASLAVLALPLGLLGLRRRKRA